MKRLFGIISLVMAFGVIVNIFYSCRINDVEDELLPQPKLEAADGDNAYNLSSEPIADMKYANIFREKSLTSDFKEVVDRQNIGQIVPNDEKKLPESFMFQDYFTENDPSIFYRYQIRYFDGVSYSFSNYTKVMPGNGRGEATIDVTDPVLKYTWNDRDLKYIMNLGTEAKSPVDFEELAVIYDNGDFWRPFTLFSEPSSVDHSLDPEKNIFNAGEPSLDLQKVFSDEFLDVNVKVIGLTGILKKEETAEKYRRYYYTVPVLLDGVSSCLYIYDVDENENCYTDKDGLSTPKPKDSPIYVPKQKQPENGFDISKSVKSVFVSESGAGDFKTVLDVGM